MAKLLRLGKPLTRRELHRLVQAQQKWLNSPEVRKMREDIRRSTQIRGEDLAIIVR